MIPSCCLRIAIKSISKLKVIAVYSKWSRPRVRVCVSAAAGASPYSMGAASGTATPMMSPAPTQDSMGYSLPAPPYDQPQPPYDAGMAYDPMHQDLSP